MRILLVHADFIEWAPVKQAMKTGAEDVEMKKSRADEVLVAFCSVEKDDEKNPEAVAKNAVTEILGVYDQVKAKSIVVYPYAHLSSSLSAPGVALRVLKTIETVLKEKHPTQRAPFGWYKSFEIKAKGHPLAELSKQVNAEGLVKSKKTVPATKIILDRSNLPPTDHRILGEDLGIFAFADEIGAGLPLWLPNGETLRFQLEKFMRDIEEKAGYQYVRTPHIAKGSIYEATGHLPYYKESMYAPIDMEGVDYYLRPMNCPHHHMIFKRLVQSYRDLPLKLAEPGTTYRAELSGVTYGLIRVKCFTQNDSHIYVTPEQLKDEFGKVLQLFQTVYKVMHIKNYWFRLSLPDFEKNPDKYTGSEKEWEHACNEIRAAMKASKVEFVEEKGEAAFYGPKIDVQIKNALGKEETIATSQVDIVVPSRLGLTYVNNKDEKKPVIVIHRAILGSYERFIAYLLEQTGGHLPLWLAPVQVKVLSFTDRNEKTAKKVLAQLQEAGIRADADFRDHTVDYKVAEAERMKIPYIVVIGDKEEESNSLAVRTRGEKKVAFGVKFDAFLKNLQKDIENKS